MSDSGFEEYTDIKKSAAPDFTQILNQRMVKGVQPNLPGFDPHAMMVKKNQIEKGEITPDPVPEVKWPEKDVEVLEDFCKQYGIIGFNAGRMGPIAALAFLKNKMGLCGGPLSERVPFGYEKTGTKNIYNSNYPYQHSLDKRTVLNG